MDINSFDYIKIDLSNELLINNIEKTYCLNNKHKTLEHVKKVAKTNMVIAKQYNLDEEKCYLAGLLHDISAIMKPNDMVDYVQFYGIGLDESEKKFPFLLHQQVSRIFAKDIFIINDLNILSAIECHTTLKSAPSKYDMALFVADKISWDQVGLPPFYDSVYAALSISLEFACLQYINYMLEKCYHFVISRSLQYKKTA